MPTQKSLLAHALAACASLLACSAATALTDSQQQDASDQQNSADQSPDQSSKDASSSREKLQEIVIHGRKPLIDTHNVNVGAFGSKDVMDVPLDLQSYSSALIDNQFARTIDDVTRNEPAVSVADVGGAYDDIRIRGFLVDWFNTMRRDGLSLAPYQDIPLESVERVDILEGPSGFLYGFNAPGGTVNFITKRPTQDPFDEITAQWRSFDGSYVHLDSSHTLGADDQFAYRTNFAYESVGDFTHNGDLEREMASGSAVWKMTDAAVLSLNADWQKKAIAAQPVIGLQPDNALPPMFDPRTLLGQPWFKYATNAADVGARLDYSLNDNWYVVGQLAYSSNKRDAAFVDLYQVDARGNILSGDLVLSPGQPYDVTSGQFFISGKFNTGYLGHELIAGLSARDYTADQGGYATLTTMTVGNLFDPVYFPDIPLAVVPPKSHSVNHQVGPFASDLITVTDKWQVMLGARQIHYSDNETSAAGVSQPYVKNSVVPSAGLIFKPVQDVMTYFNYTQGLEQGDYAPFFAKNAGIALDPLVSSQYEVGAKTRINGNLTLGMSVFEIRKTLEFVDSDNVFVESGLERHRGVEFTGSGDLTENTTLIAGVQYLNALQINTGDPTVDGKRVEDVPEWQANLYVDHEIARIPGLSINGGVNYVGNRAVGPENVAFIPSYSLVNLGARYLTQLWGQNFIFRAELKNATNKRYWSSAEYTSVYPGQPRIMYLSISTDLR